MIDSDVDIRRMEYFKGKDLINIREKVMTEEAKKMGQQIIDDFRASYNAKDRQGVFKDMEVAEKYWAGEFDDVDDTEVNSNTNIINSNIETQVADLQDQSIDVEPRPFDPSDQPYIPRVRQIADRILEENQMPLKTQRIMRRTKKFGSGWIRVLYNPKMMEGIGCPEIKSISTANVFPDVTVTNIDDIQKGRYFIEVFNASIYWAEQEFGMEKASAIVPRL